MSSAIVRPAPTICRSSFCCFSFNCNSSSMTRCVLGFMLGSFMISAMDLLCLARSSSLPLAIMFLRPPFFSSSSFSSLPFALPSFSSPSSFLSLPFATAPAFPSVSLEPLLSAFSFSSFPLSSAFPLSPSFSSFVASAPPATFNLFIALTCIVASFILIVISSFLSFSISSFSSLILADCARFNALSLSPPGMRTPALEPLGRLLAPAFSPAAMFLMLLMIIAAGPIVWVYLSWLFRLSIWLMRLCILTSFNAIPSKNATISISVRPSSIIWMRTRSYVSFISSLRSYSSSAISSICSALSGMVSSAFPMMVL
mmetsp:Transcript_21691/g.46431  ORF Transcript_21691/g.46431 Transcript_21691/m.46431 type:complete len:313 (-) Transcript_21691:89-1027(-)